MPTDVVDEVDSNAAFALVVEVAEEAEWAEMALEFLAKKWCGLTTTCVAGAVGAKKD